MLGCAIPDCSTRPLHAMKSIILLTSLAALVLANPLNDTIAARADNTTDSGNSTAVLGLLGSKLPRRDFHPCVWSLEYTSPQCCNSEGGKIVSQTCQARKSFPIEMFGLPL